MREAQAVRAMVIRERRSRRNRKAGYAGAVRRPVSVLKQC
jgi:hypothetical protein